MIGAKALNCEISEQGAHKLHTFMQLVLERNKVMNLTSVTDEDGFLAKHFFDSLAIAKYVKNVSTCIDIGTGAGFPGIPLSIALPGTDFTLLDSTNKKLKFIDEVSAKLSITNAKTLHERAEDAGQSDSHRDRYSTAVSRAVAALPLLCELCIPLVAIDGVFIAMKGPNFINTGEYADAQKIIKDLGGSIVSTHETDLPQLGSAEKISRTIIIIKKIRATPPKYPRNSKDLAKIYKKTV